jgi:hypothetical protein
MLNLEELGMLFDATDNDGFYMARKLHINTFNTRE